MHKKLFQPLKRLHAAAEHPFFCSHAGVFLMAGTKVSKTKKINRDELIKNNPRLSKTVINQYDALERQLEKLGVDTQPRYTLSSPFDQTAFNALQRNQKTH